MEKFEKAERGAAPWYTFTNKGIVPRLKRLLFLKEKYLIFTLYRLGMKKQVSAQLFFSKRMVLPLSDPNAQRIYFTGTLGAPRERNLTAFLITHLTEHDVFYDVGANFGFYTFLAETIATNGEVHSFEPNPRVCAYLARNAVGNRVVVNHLALSNRSGTATFFDLVSDSSASSLIRAETRPEAVYAETVVPVTTLDVYVRDHTPPSLIKIDVEGAERLVLEGGAGVLTRHKPTIILEVWGGERGAKYHASAIVLLESLGYRPFRIERDGSVLPVTAIDFRTIRRYENVVFKHV